VRLVHERGEAARVRDRLRREAAALRDVREARDHLGQDLGADEVVDDEVGVGLLDQRSLLERVGVEHFPSHPEILVPSAAAG
jgi:hypothetical protein